MSLDMVTRAPPAVETSPDYPDEPRFHENVTEPFLVTVRQLGDGHDVKFIWWYMAAIRGSRDRDKVVQSAGEGVFEARLFGFEEALDRITYALDRDVLKEAIKIFEENEARRLNFLDRDAGPSV